MLGEHTDFELMNLTWEEAGDAITNADFVALPCGSIEQHSIHLPLSVDTLRADQLTRSLATMAPDHGLAIAMLPTLPYGYSEHHMNYPGTVTLTDTTYRDVIIQIGRSVQRHGATRFLPINFHGGNREPLKLAADSLQRDHDLPTHVVDWTDFAEEELVERFGDDWGHAGDHETSAIEHFFPDLVRTEKKEPQTRPATFTTRRVAYFDEITEQGGLGDPTNSDPEFFASVVPGANERILEALQNDIDQEPTR